MCNVPFQFFQCLNALSPFLRLRFFRFPEVAVLNLRVELCSEKIVRRLVRPWSKVTETGSLVFSDFLHGVRG